jgi:hypothetical protein
MAVVELGDESVWLLEKSPLCLGRYWGFQVIRLIRSAAFHPDLPKGCCKEI